MDSFFVISATDIGNLSIRLLFNDNTSRIVDIGDFIRKHPHPQYNKYLDPKKFCRFSIENGNVVWGKNWDLIFPIEQLYSGKIDYFQSLFSCKYDNKKAAMKNIVAFSHYSLYIIHFSLRCKSLNVRGAGTPGRGLRSLSCSSATSMALFSC